MTSFNDLVRCNAPNCINGYTYKECVPCGGYGCQQCQYKGEDPPVACNRCQGEGQIPFTYAKIFDALRRVMVNDPDWDGNDSSRPGSSDHSLAVWSGEGGRYRYRNNLMAARGRPTQSNTEEAREVDLIHVDGSTITFHGLSWGRGGNRPTALAIILADALDLSMNTVMPKVAGLDREEPWFLTAEYLGA